MTRSLTTAWQPVDADGMEDLSLTLDAGGFRAESVVMRVEDDIRFGLRYSITGDAQWRTRRVEIALLDGGRILVLLGDGAGRWSDGDGTRLPFLDGALDTDITCTPFTNTLAIRRLGLAIGESADIVTAHVTVPALTISADPQRYTRLGPNLYRYESRDSDFTWQITVDDDGLVLDYPGLFRRLG